MASFSVVNNVAAANAQANLVQTNMGLRTALTRLSSGLRINNSGDDAAGLAVANSYRSKVAVLNQGIRNANDGLSTLQIKDGALNNISNLLDRLSTLATQSASSSSTVDRTKLNAEFKSVLDRNRPRSHRRRPHHRRAHVLGLRQQRRRQRQRSAASIAPRPTPPARRPQLAGVTVDTAVNAAAAVATIADRGRHCSAPRRATSAPSRTACSSPSAWRSRSRSTTRRPRAGFATPTSPKNRPT